MKVKEEIQFGEYKKRGYSIYSDLSKRLKDDKLKKVWIILGVVKDEAFFALEEEFNIAKDNGVEINFTIGIDRKTISEEVLTKINELSKKAYIFNNNQNDGFNSKIYIFEYEKKAEVLMPSTNFTLNGITNDISNITLISYSCLKECEEYNEFMFSIKDFVYPDMNVFSLLDESLIKQLSIKRELMCSKSGNAKMPSINDFLKNTQNIVIDEKEAEKKIKAKIKNIVKEFDVVLEDDEIKISEEELIE